MLKPDITSIVLAEELTLIREGIAGLCEQADQCQVVAQCSSGDETLKVIEQFKPVLAIIDFQIPKLHSLELIRKICESESRTQFIVMANRGDRKTALEALRAGAHRFLLKSAPVAQLMDALRHVAAGSVYVSPELQFEKVFFSTVHQTADSINSLSSREYQVFRQLVDGFRCKEIASRLEVSPKTVDTYRANLMRKLEIHDVAGLVKLAIQRDLVAL